MKTNTEVITEYTEFGQQGALNQGFLLQAVDYYAKMILADQDHLRETMANSIIHPDAWIACAQEWQYKRQQQHNENYDTTEATSE